MRAVSRHTQYAAWAADGQGVDRHLFGLKKLLKEGEPMPEIYKDPTYAKSSHWELSTSQLSSPFFDGWGYGEGQSLSVPANSGFLNRLIFVQSCQMAMAYRTRLEMTIFAGRSLV